MRDITVEEIELITGGDFSEFMGAAQNLFLQWFGTKTPTNPTLSGDQVTTLMSQCIAQHGNGTYTSGTVTGGFYGAGEVGVFRANIAGGTQSFSCTFS